MSSTKIVFPPPPPTTNTLTSQQRKQLLRSTKKLGRMLGSTPQLLDDNDAHLSGCFTNNFLAYRDEPYPDPFRRGSMDSMVSSLPSTSSSPMSSRCATPVSTLSRSSSSLRSTKSRRSSKSTISKLPARPPLLRIAFNSAPSLTTPLETIPASPASPASDPFASFSETLAGTVLDPSPRYSIRPSRTPSPRDSLVEPDFFIPSQTTLRRQKLDRLRRMLGDDVPQDLVFPQQAFLDDENEAEAITSKPPSPTRFTHSTVNIVIPSPPPTPVPSLAKPPRNNSRDSLTLPSVHRASRSKRVPVPAYDPSVPTTYTTIRISTPSPQMSPIPRVSRTPTPVLPNPPQTKMKFLSAIVECPDEHGSGCAEEFGFLGGPTGVNAGVKADKQHPYASATSPFADPPLSMSMNMKADGVSVKLWSTRKGYEGWTVSAPSYQV